LNSGSQNSFRLTENAYKKLTSNYTMNVIGIKKHNAFTTHDTFSQKSGVQKKFDEVLVSGRNPKAFQLQV